ncbi:MAG: hypothetical protein JWN86_2700 [Planctomycetota bacterium]|nr:hypothetical protein [Planctomycetota bacterium]
MRRFSLKGLMLLVAVVGAVFAALRIPPSPVRTSALFSLVVFLLLAATLGSVLRRKPSWIGFCLFGWVSLVVSFTALAVAPLISTGDKQPVPLLIPSLLLTEWHLRVSGTPPIPGGEPVAVLPNSQGGHALVPYRLVQDCTSIASLLVACVGGVLGWILRAPQSRAN